MQKNRTIHILMMMTAALLCACQNEDVPTPQEETGRIVLAEPNIQVYTRAETQGNISDYDYTITPTDPTGTPEAIVFDNGSAIVPAGTYTLTAQSKTAKDAAPYYEGTSQEFTVTRGGSTEVSINLGKPQNVEVIVTFESTFTNLYENYTITIGQKSLEEDGTLYAAVPTDSKLTYTIKGSAKAGSHVSDIPEAGITGTLTVAAGTSYPLHITAQSISDLLIEFGNGTHPGPFDVKPYRPTPIINTENGVEITDNYVHVIDNNAIRHTLKGHSGAKEELRGQVSLTEVRLGRKELAMDTMYIRKNSRLTDANSLITTQISDSPADL